MNKVTLKLDWCSHEAAAYAVEKWHYSHRMPVGKLIKVGVWENEQFTGVILYGRGANKDIGFQYGLQQTEVCELVRVALNKHVTPVSRICAISLKMIQKVSPSLKLIISYADSEQGHHGGIYQAMNWVYVGRGEGSVEFFYEGEWRHNRTITAGSFGFTKKIADHSHLPKRKTLGKHKYLYPLNDDMRQRIEPL